MWCYIITVMPLYRTTCCYIIPDKCYIVTLTGDALSGQRLTVQLAGKWCMGTYNLPTSVAQFPIWRALLFYYFYFILSSRAYQFVKIGEKIKLGFKVYLNRKRFIASEKKGKRKKYCFSRRSGLLWCFTLNFVHFKFINTLN